jgi:hypothetical protein
MTRIALLLALLALAGCMTGDEGVNTAPPAHTQGTPP